MEFQSSSKNEAMMPASGCADTQDDVDLALSKNQSREKKMKGLNGCCDEESPAMGSFPSGFI